MRRADQTAPDGGVATFTYTTGAGGAPANLLASRTDQLGRVTAYGYNAAGDLVTTTSPGGHTTTMAYDPAHRLTSATGPTGAATSYTQGAAGRMLTRTRWVRSPPTPTTTAGG